MAAACCRSLLFRGWIGMNPLAETPPEPLADNLEAKRDALLELLRQYPSCAVAYSGGVDSAVMAQAAFIALGERAVAVTGVSASLADGELAAAAELAGRIGIRHVVLATREFAQPAYVRNASDRCYHCKTELYSLLEQWAPANGFAVLLNGVNVEDLGDYRPGLRAANEHQVRSPLADCGLTKADIRALAAAWGLPVWDKPASPCLSSRVAYGEEVTPARLAMIDRGERFLRSRGLPIVRVRYHRGDVARIEAPVEELPRLVASPLREELVNELLSAGFKFVSLDLVGFRSGSLNVLIPAVRQDSAPVLVSLSPPAPSPLERSMNGQTEDHRGASRLASFASQHDGRGDGGDAGTCGSQGDGKSDGRGGASGRG